MALGELDLGRKKGPVPESAPALCGASGLSIVSLEPGFESPVLAQSVLNIDDKVRSNCFPWRGQFSPQLVEAHLAAYTRSNDIVLDPFVGSGTVLLECARRGNMAVGAEINPAAAIMARTYTLSCLPESERGLVVREVDTLVASLDRQQDLPLFAGASGQADVRSSLLREVAILPSGSSVRHLLEALVVVLDFHLGAVSPVGLRQAWSRLRAMVSGFPFAPRPIAVALADARCLPWADGYADFVFTSPPYINVFNYHQQYRESIEALGWDVLPLARSEIGSNRKNRGNRFLTVIQYCLDMAEVLTELARACKPGARAVFVVGRESNVRKTAFLNAQILLRLANGGLGIKVLLQQERVFLNRFGQDIYEDILHFRMMPVSKSAAIPAGRMVAEEVLRDARSRAPTESQEDLEAAINAVSTVESSALVQLDGQRSELARGFTI